VDPQLSQWLRSGIGEDRKTLGIVVGQVTASRLNHTSVAKAEPVQRRHMLQ
jgi:hypothetical protein